MYWADIQDLVLNRVLLWGQNEAKMTMISATEVRVDGLDIETEVNEELVQIFKGRFTDDWSKIWFWKECFLVVDARDTYGLVEKYF